MKDYLVSVIWVSLIIGLVELVSPRIEGTGKYIKYIGCICVLCVIASPLSNVIKSSGEFSSDLKEELMEGQDSDAKKDYESILKEYLTEHSIDKLKKRIKDTLEQNYSIPSGESRIVIHTGIDDGELKLEKTQIFLSGGSIFRNPYTIEEYFADMLGCPCEVAIE